MNNFGISKNNVNKILTWHLTVCKVTINIGSLMITL